VVGKGNGDADVVAAARFVPNMDAIPPAEILSEKAAPSVTPFAGTDEGQLGEAGMPVRRSLQPGVFRLGLLEDRDVGVGVLPESQEIPIGGLCFGRLSRQSERPA
jgi:hypothetical protein